MTEKLFTTIYARTYLRCNNFNKFEVLEGFKNIPNYSIYMKVSINLQ